MVRSAREPSRPITRSMTSYRTRRSPRLRGGQGRASSPLSLSFPVASIDAQLRSGSRKSKRPLTPAEVDGSLGSKLRKKCTQVQVQVERKGKHVGICENAASEGISASAGKATAREEDSPWREKELEKQLARALQVERELTVVITEYKVNTAQATLKQLEEYFTCPLCFEIMACPYALIPPNCGHTFCATCILKWFFSRLHRGCGGWHEAVDCPMCRSPLPYTPDQTPRPDFSFPFTPNRTADIAIRGSINSIFHDLASVTVAGLNPLSDWNEDGHIRQEWFKRERAGRAEISSIAAQWNTLKPMDFVNIKARLEV